MKPLLTIGMAHYEDYDGVYFTIQNIRSNYPDHLLQRIEFIVIDNSPDTEKGKLVRELVGVTKNGNPPPVAYGTAGSFYYPVRENKGTSLTRNMIFEKASGKYVICMDCHLSHWRDSITNLLTYFKENPKSKDIISGPLFFDNHRAFSTHYDPFWRDEMWGIWSRAWEKNGVRFSVRENDENRCTFHSLLTGEPVKVAGMTSNAIAYAGHELELAGNRGCVSIGKELTDEPFEIPGQGLGQFACRREAWPGFNKHARGFGGEELYIHEKFRLLGGKAICLPGFRWTHRFGRPGGPKYPITTWNKCRNYVLECQELKAIASDNNKTTSSLILDDIYNHFVLEKKKVPEAEWNELIVDPVSVVHPKGKPGNPATSDAPKTIPFKTMNDYYDTVLKTERDLDKHMPKLRELASGCNRILELSHRRESTVAFAAGLMEDTSAEKLLMSFNPETSPVIKFLADQDSNNGGNFGLMQQAVNPADVSLSESDDTFDLLFINFKHTYSAVKKVLDEYSASVGRYIVIHNSQIYGDRGEDQGPGILKAFREFMTAHPEFSVIYHTNVQYGLTVLSNHIDDKPKLPGKITMAKNFAKSVATHAADGFEAATLEVMEHRLAICSPCPSRVDTSCSICGCGLAKKASWNSSECPLDYWNQQKPGDYVLEQENSNEG